VGGRAGSTPRQLLRSGRPPDVVDQCRRITGDRVKGQLQVLGPQSASGGRRQHRVVDHEVHLRVVEERVLVEVRRAEGQPAVVDDSDLCVDVDRLRRATASRNERVAEQSFIDIGLSTASSPRVSSAPTGARAAPRPSGTRPMAAAF
jgi:hypothetical protein